MSKLINCPTCKKKISVNANTCPNCGEPITASLKKKTLRTERIGAIIGTIILIILFYAAITNSWTNSSKDSTNQSSYDWSDYKKAVEKRKTK